MQASHTPIAMMVAAVTSLNEGLRSWMPKIFMLDLTEGRWKRRMPELLQA
jgi:hypothetical protein